MPLREINASDSRALQSVADALAGSHKILLITGAGISTSCGIPDFRSKDGLYNLIPEQAVIPTPPVSQPSTPSRKRKSYTTDDDEPPSSQTSIFSSSSARSSPSSKLKGQDLFNSRVFQSAESTTMFYKFIATLRQKIRDEVKETSATHKLIRTLRDGGRLMRCYTQNIDGLESREGMCLDLARGRGNKRRFMKKNYQSSRPRIVQGTDFDGGCEVVQLHGELTNLRCNLCTAEREWTDDETKIFLNGAAPKCEKCTLKSDLRQATGKRGLSIGSLRPNIVLYGEDHPQNTLLTPLIPFDVSCAPDLLIIMGTSLKVFGLQKIVREFAKAVHNQKNGMVIFVNRTRPAESVWDGIIDDFVAMDCDDWVENLREQREDLWLRQGALELKATKSAGMKRKRSASDDSGDIVGTPSKKPKVLYVEVPQIPQSRPRQKNSMRTSATSQIRATTWKEPQSTDYKGRDVLSPLAQAKRPLPSPLSQSFKADSISEQNGVWVAGSPQTPTYSPLTPVWDVREAARAHLRKLALESAREQDQKHDARSEVITIEDDDDTIEDADDHPPVPRLLSFMSTDAEDLPPPKSVQRFRKAPTPEERRNLFARVCSWMQ